jgi:hypothetical protein
MVCFSTVQLPLTVSNASQIPSSLGISSLYPTLPTPYILYIYIMSNSAQPPFTLKKKRKAFLSPLPPQFSCISISNLLSCLLPSLSLSPILLSFNNLPTCLFLLELGGAAHLPFGSIFSLSPHPFTTLIPCLDR